MKGIATCRNLIPQVIKIARKGYFNNETTYPAHLTGSKGLERFLLEASFTKMPIYGHLCARGSQRLQGGLWRFPLTDPAGRWLPFFPNYATHRSVDESAFVQSWTSVATFRRSDNESLRFHENCTIGNFQGSNKFVVVARSIIFFINRYYTHIICI